MINPVLTELAVYPFTRLEEERRRLLAAGVDVIDFGKGDPNEPTDPMIRQALVDALPERAPYPLAQGLPELREAAAGWLERRFGVAVDPDAEVVPTYGSKEAIFSLAQVLGTGGRVVVFGEPAYPVYERGALFAGARVQTMPLRRENGFLPDLDEVDDDAALVWVNYPHNPTGAVAPRRFYDELAEAAERHDFVVGSDEAYTELLVRRAAAVGAPGSRPFTRRRLPDVEQALVDDRLPLRIRRGTAGDRGGSEGVPPDRGHGAAGVRAARVRRGLERRAARRGDPRALPRETGRADPAIESRGWEIVASEATMYLWVVGPDPAALLERGIIVSPGEMFGPSGEGYVRFALVPTLEECVRAVEILREPA